MKEGFVFWRGGHSLSHSSLLISGTLRGDHIFGMTDDGFLSQMPLLFVFGAASGFTVLPLTLTTCRHLRWAAFFQQRHRVSDGEWTGKPLCLVWRRENLLLESERGQEWAELNSYYTIIKEPLIHNKLFQFFSRVLLLFSFALLSQYKLMTLTRQTCFLSSVNIGFF